MRVLFVDVHDTCRGPMAEAIARAYGLDAESVGTAPGPFVAAQAEHVMARKGLHVRSHRPHWIDLHHLHGGFDHVIALGVDVDAAPMEVGQHWNVPDPEQGGLDAFVQTQKVLERQIRRLALGLT